MNTKNLPFAHLAYTEVSGVKNYTLRCAIELEYFNFATPANPWNWIYQKSGGIHYITLIVSYDTSVTGLTFDGKITALPKVISPGKIFIHIKDQNNSSDSYFSRVCINTDDADKEGSGDGNKK